MRATFEADAPMTALRRMPIVYALIVGDAAVISLYSIGAGGSFTWWLVALGLVAVGGVVLPVPQWLSRWAPMLLIGVLFLALGSLSQRQGANAVRTLPIEFDRALTGAVVPVWLQQHAGALLAAPAGAFVAEYMAHYAAPLLTALWLWRQHRSRFDGFVTAYFLAMVLGFAVYLVFPQSPPWYAAQHGLLPPLHRSIVDVLQSVHAGSLYAGLDPEPFGAMPSLHVTIPVVVAATMIAVQESVWRWAWILYPLTVAFGVLLMAEHYLIDTAAGAVVGVAAMSLVRVIPMRYLSGSGGDRDIRAVMPGRGDPEPA